MKQKNALHWLKKSVFFLALCCFLNISFADTTADDTTPQTSTSDTEVVQTTPSTQEDATPPPSTDTNKTDLSQEVIDPSNVAQPEQKQSNPWWDFILKGRPQKSKQISPEPPKTAPVQEKDPWTQNENGYEINFNNVSIVEVIKTISKMTKLNFVFDESQLTFNVTIVSSGPTSLANLISSFVQVLQVNGYTLSEEGNAFVIHSVGEVNSLAKFVLPNEQIPFETALITKAFSLENLAPSYILETVKPLLSQSALIEASDSTRHLIITDTPGNIAALQRLVTFLDSPNESAQIGVYKVSNFYASSLTTLADKILQALPDKTDVLLIPQDTSENIIIVATPYLVKKTQSLLKQLDQVSIASGEKQQKQVNFENIFLYTPQFRSYEAVLSALKLINTNLEEMGSSYSDLKDVVESAYWIQDISAFLFVGDPQNISKLQAILKDIDSASTDAYPSSTVLFTYDPQYITTEDLTTALQNVATNLKALKNAAPALIHMLESIHIIPKTESVIFVGEKIALAQLQEILKSVDIDIANVPIVKSPNFNFLVYDLKFITFNDLNQSLQDITQIISKTDDPDKTLIDTINSIHYIQDTNSVIFTGSKRSLQNVESLLEKFDTEDQQQRAHQQFFIYKPQNRKPKDIQDSLQEMTSYLKTQEMIDPQMLDMIESVKLIQDTGSLLFVGSQQTYTQIETLLQNIDIPAGQITVSALGTSNYLIYSITAAQEVKLMDALKELAKKLQSTPTPDNELIFALQHPEYISQTHSLIFVGDDNTLKEISDIMSKLDISPAGQSITNFVLYVPQYLEPQEVIDDLNVMASQLSDSGLNDQSLILTLSSGVYSKKTGAIIFTGTEDSLGKTQNILKTLDVPDSSVGQHLFIYKPQNLSPKELLASLQAAVKQLDGKSEYQLNTAIKNGKIIAGSLSFKGSEASVHHIQEMIKTLDTITPDANQQQIFIYTPQYMSITQLKNNLENLVDKLEQDPSSSSLVSIIKESYVEKKSNAVVFKGPAQILDQIKTVLQELDQPSTKEEAIFVYTLKNVSIKDATYYLSTVEDHLKEAPNPDHALIDVIESAKSIPQSNSLMFTGKALAITQLQELLAKYDSPDNAPSPKQSQSAFIMYTPKYISGSTLVSNLKSAGKELQDSGLANPYLIKSLQTARYNHDSNSVIVTGNDSTLKDVKDLISHFDTTKAAPSTTGSKSNYLVYKPKFVTGPTLENWMVDSTKNLEKSGLNDPKLIDALKSMHYNSDTGTLTFSGDQQSLAKVQDLINDYDNESNAQNGESGLPSSEGLTFLVYKLQYHQGDEIIDALSSISTDLRKYQTGTENDVVLNAISSVQWLKITNSLLISGSSTTLQKIKSLIQKLDIPLQQIFLEVLIIRTSALDILNFGLRWGTAGTILKKFSTAFGLFPDTGNFTNLNKFGSNILNAGGTTTPAPTTVGANGFDLGVIGDIIFHKGKSFLTLGALVAALQKDSNDTSIQTHNTVAQDNQQAHIFSGFNRPFDLSSFTQQISTGGTNSTATNEYRDVGFDLQITPIIGGDDIITLIIDQKFTESSAEQLNNVQSNTVSKQVTTTRVRAPNNHFIALSGALTDTRSRAKTGIPCLGGLPVVGALFSDVTRTNQKDNIIIFIRPQIITSDQQVVNMTERQEDRFRENAGSLELQYDVDDAINMMVPIDEIE
ncbi:MAG: Type II secretion system protein D [Chlamydiae bacterium]|nr:Type II secretion system protein D [Chlamydiota bacterium]